MMEYINAEEIRRAVNILKPNNQLFEIRIIRGSLSLSGYFNNTNALIDKLNKVGLERCNVYMTLQEVHSGCEARIQWNQFVNSGKEKIPTTSDKDVVRYKYIPIDLDPVRPSGISSTEEEMQAAEELLPLLITYMRDQGYTDYIEAFSGNGYHLLFKIDKPNTKEVQADVKELLKHLDDLFSNDACHVDTTNYNPSRILKLYGTLAQKGRSTEDRPFRMSKILEVHNA